VGIARVNESTSSALCSWGDCFEIDLGNIDPECVDVELECICKGVFSPDYGNVICPLPLFLGTGYSITQVKEALNEARSKESSLSSKEEDTYLKENESKFRIEGELNTIHANLDAKRVSVHSGGEKKLRAHGNRANESMVQNADANSVSLRIFSQVVVGTAAAVAIQKGRVQGMVDTAIRERKEIVARTEALAGRGDDDDEDDMFVLDPTSFTFQSLRMTIDVSKNDPLRFTCSSLYVVPNDIVENGLDEGFDMAKTSPVPFLRATLSGINATINASNNPWIADCELKMHSLALELANSDYGSGLSVVLMLPPSSIFLGLQQTSTSGRLLAGFSGSTLDESCFDWLIKGNLGPFCVDMKRVGSSGDGGKTGQGEDSNTFIGTVWETSHIMSHLFQTFPRTTAFWSRGIFSPKIGNEDGSAPRVVTPEAAIRLGDPYTTFPLFRNTVQRVSLCATLAANDATGQNDIFSMQPLSNQRTGVRIVTASRQMSAAVDFAPSRSSIVRTDLRTVGREDNGDTTNPKSASGWTLFGRSANTQEVESNSHAVYENRLAAMERLHAAQQYQWQQEREGMQLELEALRAQNQK
jgi:hypothetical protein